MGVETGARSYLEIAAEIVRRMAAEGYADPAKVQAILEAANEMDRKRRGDALAQAAAQAAQKSSVD
jgi:hypothetical protein